MSAQPRQPAGATGSTGGQFSAKRSGEADVDLAAPQRFTASIRLQRWDDRDDLVDVDTVRLDITGYLTDLDNPGREKLLENGGNSDVGDLIAEWATRKGVFTHDGPFTVDFDEIDLAEWMDANPPWVQDGVTPHPTGGYVRVQHTTSVTMYLNADGGLHRLDGPAVESADGARGWYVDGRPHRLDGPAQDSGDSIPGRHQLQWWVDGQQVASEVREVAAGWAVVDGVAVREG